MKLGGPDAGAVSRLPDLTQVGHRAFPPVYFRSGPPGLTAWRQTDRPVWAGRVSWRAGHLKVRWRRLGRRHKLLRQGTLLRAGQDIWVVDKTPPVQSHPSGSLASEQPVTKLGPEKLPKGNKQLWLRLAPLAAMLAGGAVMLAVTGQWLWALGPLIGALASLVGLVNQFNSTGRADWIERVQGLGASEVLVPADWFTFHGPKAAVLALCRTWAANQTALQTPKNADWAWTRFTANNRPSEPSTIELQQSAGQVTWSKKDATGPKVHLAVRSAGLGLLAFRVDGREPQLVVGLSAASALERNRAVCQAQEIPATPGLCFPSDSARLLAKWSGDVSLIQVGQTSRGKPLLLDLVRDGPHMLVAGATG
ncbi:MAG: DUF4111 domain-containing protein, partial [Micrococcales bacterium]|nr:DUF4111 domain-containing protein [Micrococcales bacterium]